MRYFVEQSLRVVVKFQNSLGTIYTVYIEKISVELESLVGTLLSGIRVPPPGSSSLFPVVSVNSHVRVSIITGGPLVKFSLGAGDRQAVQPPLTGTIPISRDTVAVLFQQLGTLKEFKH